jgi:plastocyanin
VSPLRLTAIGGLALAWLVAPSALLADEPGAGSVVKLETGSPASRAAATTATISTGNPSSSPPTSSTGNPSFRRATISTGARSSSRPASPQAGASATRSVTVGDYFYRPKDLTVEAGDTVSWVNEGGAPEGHTVTGDGFDSGVMHKGDTYDHRFGSPGSFDYVCTLHPNMTGSVTVTASSTSAGGGGGGSSEGSGATNAGGGVTASGTTEPPPAAGGSGGSLASTGFNLLLLAEIGACLLASGLLVRKLIRA